MRVTEARLGVEPDLGERPDDTGVALGRGELRRVHGKAFGDDLGESTCAG